MMIKIIFGLKIIFCMPNFYKIFTETLTAQLRRFCEIKSLLSENQLGTVRYYQSAKEQTLSNKHVVRF